MQGKNSLCYGSDPEFIGFHRQFLTYFYIVITNIGKVWKKVRNVFIYEGRDSHYHLSRSDMALLIKNL